jgi:hypothetical protein
MNSCVQILKCYFQSISLADLLDALSDNSAMAHVKISDVNLKESFFQESISKIKRKVLR